MALHFIEMTRNEYNDGWESDQFLHMEGERNSYYSAAIVDKGRIEAGSPLIPQYAFIFPRALVIDNHGGSSKDIHAAIEVKRGDIITLKSKDIRFNQRKFAVTDGGWLHDPKLVEVR